MKRQKNTKKQIVISFNSDILKDNAKRALKGICNIPSYFGITIKGANKNDK